MAETDSRANPARNGGERRPANGGAGGMGKAGPAEGVAGTGLAARPGVEAEEAREWKFGKHWNQSQQRDRYALARQAFGETVTAADIAACPWSRLSPWERDRLQAGNEELQELAAWWSLG